MHSTGSLATFSLRSMRHRHEGRSLGFCPKVNLQVRPANTDVVAFYRSVGYEIEDRVSMARRLERYG